MVAIYTCCHHVEQYLFSVEGDLQMSWSALLPQVKLGCVVIDLSLSWLEVYFADQSVHLQEAYK